ncbi:hypothetical protein B9Z44_07070 [Limnohabitans curvus]|uniref:DNA primase n=1 Tax=Limnohabitans curvus TaxID=323423 RepID=A0A315EQ43_9BURK|nr:hypothetical protein [Limnohabitans curvus]PUE59349.1 hypothetical protein B9Z44_07070 [Limnohabitans curvus]
MNAIAEIKKMWQIFSVEPSSVLELRAIWPKGHAGAKRTQFHHFRVHEFKDVKACQASFEEMALALNATGYNIYIVMNPINREFAGSCASDADIRVRQLLLIDIDRKGDTSVPASQMELNAAHLLSSEVRAFLETQNWQTPFEVMSGNGYHLYYPLSNLPCTDKTKNVIQCTLKNLASRFDNAVVAIDTVVYNASRITKVPGTIARKGVESQDRPYRMAVVL